MKENGGAAASWTRVFESFYKWRYMFVSFLVSVAVWNEQTILTTYVLSYLGCWQEPNLHPIPLFYDTSNLEEVSQCTGVTLSHRELGFHWRIYVKWIVDVLQTL